MMSHSIMFKQKKIIIIKVKQVNKLIAQSPY